MRNLIYYFLLFIICSCNQKNQESNLNGFDISPDIKNIIFSYKKDSLYSIYSQSLKTSKANIILSGSGNYINPKYAENEKIIVSLYYPNKKLSPEFHIYDLISRKITKKIRINHGFVSDYTISPHNKIFYLQAKTYKSYSQIAPKAYHDYDIYELDLITFTSKKISNLNLYYMGEVLSWKNNSLLVSMQSEPNESGLFFFDIKSDINKKTNLKKIIIKNDTLRNSTMYSNPVILSNYNILCASSYQMVELNLESKIEYPILSSTGYHYNIIRSRQDKVFFKQNDNTNKIYFFDLNDKNIHSININLPPET